MPAEIIWMSRYKVIKDVFKLTCHWFFDNPKMTLKSQFLNIFIPINPVISLVEIYYNKITKSFFSQKILFIFRQRGKRGGRERNINVWLPLTCPLLVTWPTTQARDLTGNWTCDPLVHRPVLNPLSYTSQTKWLNLHAHVYLTVAYVSEKWEEIKRPII